MGSISAVEATTVMRGVWGAEGAVLTIEAQRTRIEWDTAEAIINGPIKPDAKGRFRATGHYHAYTPGPDRADATPAMRDAHIEGSVTGDTIEMTMHVTGERAMRRYIFKKGQQTKLHRMM